MDTFFKFLMGVGILFIVSVGILSLTGWHYIEGKGQHTGYVTAVSEHGIIWDKTKVYFKTDTQSSQEDEYCVIDKDLINNLTQVSESRRQVTVMFTTYLFTSITECSNSNQVITGISIQGN